MTIPMTPEASATPDNPAPSATPEGTTLLGAAQPEAAPSAAAPTAPAATEPTPPAAPEAPAVPEKYDLKLPEGSLPDSKLMEGFEPLAKDLKLTNDQAQKLVDFSAKHTADLVRSQEQALAAERKGWREEFEKSPGAAESLSHAKRALDQLANPAAKALLTNSWLGDHPAVIDLLANAGKLLAEHPLHTGGEPQATRKSDAEVFFPNQPTKGK